MVPRMFKKPRTYSTKSCSLTVLAGLLPNLHSPKLALAGRLARLAKTLLLASRLGLLARDNATLLVLLEVALCQATRCVVSRSVHNLSARSNRNVVHFVLN